jgi:hypothetical protein
MDYCHPRYILRPALPYHFWIQQPSGLLTSIGGFWWWSRFSILMMTLLESLPSSFAYLIVALETKAMQEFRRKSLSHQRYYTKCCERWSTA